MARLCSLVVFALPLLTRGDAGALRRDRRALERPPFLGGDEARAERCLRRALGIDPNHGTARGYLERMRVEPRGESEATARVDPDAGAAGASRPADAAVPAVRDPDF